MQQTYTQLNDIYIHDDKYNVKLSNIKLKTNEPTQGRQQTAFHHYGLRSGLVLINYPSIWRTFKTATISTRT